QHADFEPLFLAVCERTGDAVAHCREPDDLEDPIDAFRFLLALAPEQRLARAPVALERKPDIVLDGVHVEDGGLLELAADAQERNLGLVEAGEVVGAGEIDFSGVRPGLAGDDIHHWGLARAVWTDECS